MEGLLKGSIEEFASLENFEVVKILNIFPTKRGFHIVTDVFPGKYFPVKYTICFANMYADLQAGYAVQMSFTSVVPIFTREVL